MQDELDEMRRQLEEMAAVLTAVHNAPPGSRVFTADGTGGVRLGSGGVRRTRATLALPARSSG